MPAEVVSACLIPRTHMLQYATKRLPSRFGRWLPVELPPLAADGEVTPSDDDESASPVTLETGWLASFDGVAISRSPGRGSVSPAVGIDRLMHEDASDVDVLATSGVGPAAIIEVSAMSKATVLAMYMMDELDEAHTRAIGTGYLLIPRSTANAPCDGRGG